MDYLELFGVVTGLIYLYLEIKQLRLMWILGFISSFVYIFVFFHSKIYAYMSFNVYYALISMYGFFQWTRKSKPIQSKTGTDSVQKSLSSIVYRRLNWKISLLLLCLTILIYIIIYYILLKATDSPVPAVDAVTTSIGIIASWMLAKKYIEQWPCWIIADLISVYVYYLRDLYPTMILYAFYAIMAVVGWLNWKKGFLEDEK